MSTTAQPLAIRAVPAGVAALAATSSSSGSGCSSAPRSFYEPSGRSAPTTTTTSATRDAGSSPSASPWPSPCGSASWRVPLLTFAVVQFALHAVNHVVDAGEADPGWVGVFDAVSLSLATVVLVVLLAAARRHEQERP